MSKIRVHALAKELGLSSKELIEQLNVLDVEVKNHMSTLEKTEADLVRDILKDNKEEDAANDKGTKAKQDDNNEKKAEDKNRPHKTSKGKESQKVSPESKHEKPSQETKVKKHVDNKPKKGKQRNKHKNVEKNKGDDTITKIQTPITVKDFAGALAVPVAQVITKLIGLGVMISQNESLDNDMVMILAEELKKDIEIIEPEKQATIEEEYNLEYEDNPNFLKPRPPVVTVMGHVDHGKTSLLDVIKSSRVTEGEAGGITQHIGAYTVNVRDKKVTFLDTPGHEAFTSMRSRGAKITDIAILVVAADDGVMPQTIEAISHAKAAEVPIIVAINKIDKPTANIDRVKQELLENGLMPEDWGGDTITVPVSAKANTGIDDLLEMILLVAEMQELTANPNRKAIGTIIEAQLDKGKGPMATVLIQKGTLRFGDNIVSGTSSGRIRAMIDDKNKNVKKAGPSVPVVVLGLNEVPNAGDMFYAVEDDKIARSIADTNRENVREAKLLSTNKVSLENLFERIKQGEIKDLNIVLKADVKGSVEAVAQSLLKLSNEEVNINIIHSGAGGINESDISLANASNALVIGFNVRPNINALELAKSEEVDVRTYRVIYDIINDVQAAVTGMLEPDIVEEILGRCEVRQTFKLPNGTIVAGIYVVKGKILRNSNVKILRDDIVIHEGPIGSLKRFKDDAKEIATGYEGGLSVDGFNDIKEGDYLESYILKEVKREL